MRRNLSLTGLYYRFSTYGESIFKPAIIAAITVGLSTLVLLVHSNPTLQPSFSSSAHIPYSNFTGLVNATNYVQWQAAFKRRLEDFVPVLSIESDIKVLQSNGNENITFYFNDCKIGMQEGFEDKSVDIVKEFL